MRALHFGAGNIGRGFIGKLLSYSGFHVVFSDINLDLVKAINFYQEYTIRSVGREEDKKINIKNISAIHINDPNIMKIISTVEVITTSVGSGALKIIAKIIAKGIILKSGLQSIINLNIIACENKSFASSDLKNMVLKNLPIEYYSYVKKYIGFIDCSVDKIIPSIPVNKKNILFLIAESFEEWIVNPMQFKGQLPKIIGMKFSNNLLSFMERKLLTLNTGHAIAAYLGLIKKYQTIHESLSDKKIRHVVRNAMEESGNVLVQRYNFHKKDHFSYIDEIFLRFSNPFIIDKLERIARNPLQKLEKNGRLINPFLGAIQYHLPYLNLIKGISAALFYYNKEDIESVKMHNLIRKKGILKALCIISGLNKGSEEIEIIAEEYAILSKRLSLQI